MLFRHSYHGHSKDLSYIVCVVPTDCIQFEDVPTTPIVGEVTPELGTAPPKPYHGLGYNYVTVDVSEVP